MIAKRRTSTREIIVHPAFPLAQTQAESRPVNWNELPLDMELCQLAQVNRACRKITECQQLWRALTCSKFGVHPATEPVCWKEMYRFHRQLLHDLVFRRAGTSTAQVRNGVIFINTPIAA